MERWAYAKIEYSKVAFWISSTEDLDLGCLAEELPHAKVRVSQIPKSQPRHWYYEIKVLRDDQDCSLWWLLNHLGTNGWEAFSVIHYAEDPSRWFWLLKRRLPGFET